MEVKKVKLSKGFDAKVGIFTAISRLQGGFNVLVFLKGQEQGQRKGSTGERVLFMCLSQLGADFGRATSADLLE